MVLTVKVSKTFAYLHVALNLAAKNVYTYMWHLIIVNVHADASAYLHVVLCVIAVLISIDIVRDYEHATSAG